MKQVSAGMLSPTQGSRVQRTLTDLGQSEPISHKARAKAMPIEDFAKAVDFGDMHKNLTPTHVNSSNRRNFKISKGFLSPAGTKNAFDYSRIATMSQSQILYENYSGVTDRSSVKHPYQSDPYQPQAPNDGRNISLNWFKNQLINS
jgi:hypothetical protein